MTVIKLGPEQSVPKEEDVQERFVTGGESFKASEAPEPWTQVEKHTSRDAFRRVCVRAVVGFLP